MADTKSAPSGGSFFSNAGNLLISPFTFVRDVAKHRGQIFTAFNDNVAKPFFGAIDAIPLIGDITKPTRTAIKNVLA